MSSSESDKTPQKEEWRDQSWTKRTLTILQDGSSAVLKLWVRWLRIL